MFGGTDVGNGGTDRFAAAWPNTIGRTASR